MQDRRPADEADAGVPDPSEAEYGPSREAKRRERFARALARSAFGRHYWDDRMQSELRDQMRKSKQRGKS
jgi:hypothetical protein